MTYFLHCTCISLLLSVSNASDTLEYYERLWNESIANAKNWTRPLYNAEFRNISDNNFKAYGTYDYIIVGGGTAGAVLANRLTENTNITVLVIEAGGNESDFSRIPLASNSTKSSNMNWGYLTVPQNHACYAATNKQCIIPTGKVLGGTTSINSMLYIRGNRQDYDNWAAIGCDGWWYEDVLPYFKKSENAMVLDDNLTNNGYHGKIGPWKISYLEPKSPYTNIIISANEEIGLKNIDYNADEQIGVARMQTNIYLGQRQSTNRAYLEPVLYRKNLMVLTHAFVTKIILKRKTAKSVIFRYKNNSNIAKANKEILLTAGAVNSAQLLLLSGIGPRNNLSSLGIKVYADLPVGKHLVDQVGFNLQVKTNVSVSNLPIGLNLQDYINGQGSLTYTDGMEIASFSTNGTPGVPDVQVVTYYDVGVLTGFNTNLNNSDSLNKNRFPFNMEIDNYCDIINDNVSVLQQNIILLHPKSRGTVTLKTSDPTDYPNIDPNYLSNIDDLHTMYLGLLRQMEMVATNAFKGINATLIAPVSSERCHTKTSNLERWYCIIQNEAFGMSQLTGTCRMGKTAKTSVVNVHFKVHGFRNLRVIDASVLPLTISSSDLSSVVVMMAEKAADLIKATLGD